MKKLRAILTCLAIMIFVSGIAFAEDENDIVKKYRARIKKMVLNMRAQNARAEAKKNTPVVSIKTGDAESSQVQAIASYDATIQYPVSVAGPDPDILKMAVDYLSEVLDINDLPLASWVMDTNGIVSFKFALNRQQFGKKDYIIMVTVNPVTGSISTMLPKIKEWIMAANEVMAEYFNADSLHVVDIINRDGVAPNGAFLLYVGYEIGGTEIGFHINRITGEVFFSTTGDWRYGTTALAVRQDIALRMGMDDVEEVHINDIVLLGYQPHNFTMNLTATVDNYALNLEYIYAGNPMPGYTRISLKSFIDSSTGNDYVEEAKEQLADLFNVDSNNSSGFAVSDWTMENDALQLNMSGNRSFSITIPVTINLTAGQSTIDPMMADLVMMVRNDVSERLQTDITDVHINGLQHGYSLKDGKIEWDLNKYRFNISTPQFTLIYEHNMENGVTQLISCVNQYNNINLCANVIDYLHQNYGEDTGLVNWNITADGTSILFEFSLVNGETIGVVVAVETGDCNITSSKVIDSEMEQRKIVEAQIDLKGNGKNYIVAGQMADAPKESSQIQKKQ